MAVAFRVIEREPNAPLPVTPAEALGHLRLVGVVSESDPDLLLKLAAACEIAEAATGRVLRPGLIEATVTVPDTWDGVVLLPGGPVEEVTLADYMPTYGGTQSLDVTGLALEHAGDLSQLRAVTGWQLAAGSRVRLRLRVGEAPAPETLRAAILLLLGHLWGNREAVSDARAAEVPMGAQYLLSMNRVNWGV